MQILEKESRTFSRLETKIAKQVSKFFARLEKEVLKNLEEQWGHISFSFQLSKISEPTILLKDDYYELLNKELTPVYEKGKQVAKRRYDYALKKRQYSAKADTDYFYNSDPLRKIKKIHWSNIEGSQIKSAISTRTKLPSDSYHVKFTDISKDNSLFGISKTVSEELFENNFVASEKTMNRVTQEINEILSDQYFLGNGIEDTGKAIQHKFSQLKGYEAKRIARTETHTAQELGIQAEYDELGVEYTQWLAHIDERTRGTHRDVHLEIIPRGSTFRNGLKYPGDKNGAIEEWINCRCVDIPYIPPFGMMFPPGRARYRESDLIPNPTANQNLKKFSVDDLLSGRYKQQLKSQLKIKEKVSQERVTELIEKWSGDDPFYNQMHSYKPRISIEEAKNMTDAEFDEMLKKFESVLEDYYADIISYEDLNFYNNFKEIIGFEVNNTKWAEKLEYVELQWGEVFDYLLDDYNLKRLEEELKGLTKTKALKKLKEDYGFTESLFNKFKSVFVRMRQNEGVGFREENLLKFINKYFPKVLPKQKIKSIDLKRLNPKQKERYELLLEDYTNGDLFELDEPEFNLLQESIRDTDIISIKERIIDFRLNGFHGTGKVNGRMEEFYVYSFKDTHYKIYLSKELDNTYFTPTNIKKIIESNGKLFKDSTKKIIFSNQETHILDSGGWSTYNGNVVILKNTNHNVLEDWKRFNSTIFHEVGHNIDKIFGRYLFSGDKEFEKRMKLDHRLRRRGSIIKTERPTGSHNPQEDHNFIKNNSDKIWITAYARNKRYLDNYGNLTAPELTEAWAECIEAYSKNRKWFKDNYPNTYNYIDELFKEYEKYENIRSFLKKYNIIRDYDGSSVKNSIEHNGVPSYQFKLSDLSDGKYEEYLKLKFEDNLK